MKEVVEGRLMFNGNVAWRITHQELFVKPLYVFVVFLGGAFFKLNFVIFIKICHCKVTAQKKHCRLWKKHINGNSHNGKRMSEADLSCHPQPGKTSLSKHNMLYTQPRGWTSRKPTALTAHY